MKNHNLCIPEVISKRLAITEYADGRRKVQISSNMLDMIGLPAETKVVERVLDSGGYIIERADAQMFCRKPKKVYQREYKNRRSNPFESVIETTSKAILSSIPTSAKFVHITMLYGRVIVKSVVDKVAERLATFMTSRKPNSVFSACSSGIDAHAAQSVGFDIVSALDWRPNESRDKKDLTETGMLSFLSNVNGLKHFFNEDIYELSSSYVKHITKSNPSNLFIVSSQCCDFSLVKSSGAKADSLADLSSTLDMILPILSFIKEMGFPMIMMENVAPFGNSQMGDVWDLQLRRMGYQTYTKIIDARDHEGHTSRKRFFSFATVLPVPFEWPETQARPETPLWDRLIKGNLERFRDVSHSVSLQKGVETGRIRMIDRHKTYSPTPLKSQLRMCKDSVCIEGEKGEILFPDEALLKELMTIPNEFDLDISTTTIASEIIGQGVDYSLYKQLMLSVKQHMELCRPSSDLNQFQYGLAV